ncbi:MAG: glycosyltransferase family 4 protein [Terrimicrobiaceae bacterium]
MFTKKQLIIVVGSGDYTGACKMAHLYGREFRAQGWQVTFIVGDPPRGDSTRLADVLREDGFAVLEESGFFRLRDPGLIARVRKTVKAISPAFVLSTVQIDLKIVGPVCRGLEIPYIVFDQTLHKFFGKWPLPWFKKMFFAREMRAARAVVAVGPAVRDQAVKEFGCQTERTFVVPNGIVTADYHGERQEVPTHRGERVRGLNIGRIDPQKGQQVLAEALATVCASGVKMQIDLVGGATPNHPVSENYFRELQEVIRRLQIGEVVHFLGWRSDVRSLLADYDFYVHSALWEGPPLPLSVLEAMASGLPVILTDCVGRPGGFVDGVHGRVVEAGDSRSLADALSWMALLSQKERADIGENCRKLAVERYDVSVTGKQFVEICESVIRE